ncbi:hypothetical protein ACFOTF_12930 [Mycolicibacterium holsaticum]|nr:hypothetical protein [Mycolicibacterium holsaticum]QZA15476.1 hypothetical protein K3U96_22225 [Mycolicibacterium holsaticum DSM 44478 = JCM 12374]UNC10658.1 hypothetical protein H5U41_04595 [Mycolicibacterium holsaticum DSM 44478 = JCM 12374]
MASRGSDSDWEAAFFGVLILIWVVITYYWIILGVAAAVGLFFGVRALVRREQERRLEAADEAKLLALRADRQHRWASRGDKRGVYGVEGAELMRSITSQPEVPPADTPDEKPRVAAIAHTAAELDALLREKPAEWRWGVFVSILVQRSAKLRSRIRDCELHYSSTAGRYLRTGKEVAAFVEDRIADLTELTSRLESFIEAPAFTRVFGEDDSDADADGILHVANRLMDFYERYLDLAERCRDASVPSAYTGLMRDCSQLMAVPLEGIERFMDEMVEVAEELPTMRRYTSGAVDFGTVTIEIVADAKLVKRIDKQLRAAARS